MCYVVLRCVVSYPIQIPPPLLLNSSMYPSIHSHLAFTPGYLFTRSCTYCTYLPQTETEVAQLNHPHARQDAFLPSLSPPSLSTSQSIPCSNHPCEGRGTNAGIYLLTLLLNSTRDHPHLRMEMIPKGGVGRGGTLRLAVVSIYKFTNIYMYTFTPVLTCLCARILFHAYTKTYLHYMYVLYNKFNIYSFTLISVYVCTITHHRICGTTYVYTDTYANISCLHVNLYAYLY